MDFLNRLACTYGPTVCWALAAVATYWVGGGFDGAMPKINRKLVVSVSLHGMNWRGSMAAYMQERAG